MTLIYTSTTSKIKPKQKSKAEREAHAAWCAKYGIKASGKSRKKQPVTIVKSPAEVSGVVRRETPVYPSVNTMACSTAPVEKKEYTGNKMVGIAAMHKSNLVPIFNDDSAKDVATMRR